MNHSLDDRIRMGLDRVAGDLDVEPISADAVARRGGVRRWRRGGLAVGATGALVAAGLVVMSRGGDSEIQMTGGAGAQEAAVSGPETPSHEAAPPAPDDDPTADDTTDSSWVESAAESGPDRLLPWNDGLLAISTRWVSPLLSAEFAEALAAIAPAEVAEAFPDGLPATADEMWATLDEAGLVAVMADVFVDHPDIEAMMYGSEPPPPPTISAEFSSDGVRWDATDFDPPIDAYAQFGVSDERLVAWGVSEPGQGAFDQRFQVAVTSDLGEWDLAEHEVASGRTADTPEYVQNSVWVSSAVVIDDTWFAVVNAEQHIDYEQLLPADVRSAIERNGYSLGEDDDGIEISYEDPDTGDEIDLNLTWAELGVDPQVVAQIGERYESSRAELLIGDFAGRFDRVPAPTGLEAGGSLVEFDGSVLATGGELSISEDGLDWRPIDGLPDDAWVNPVAQLASGDLLLVGGDPSGGQAWLLAESREITETSLPDLFAHNGVPGETSNGAFVVDTSEETRADIEPVSFVVEKDGLAISLTSGDDGETIVATDTATGAVVFEHSANWDDPDAGEVYEFDEATGEGALVLRDQDGSELVRLTDDELQAAFEEHHPELVDEPAVEEEWNPDLWVVATRDGRTWSTFDIDDDEAALRGAVAILGDHVVAWTSNGWERFPLD